MIVENDHEEVTELPEDQEEINDEIDLELSEDDADEADDVSDEEGDQEPEDEEPEDEESTPEPKFTQEDLDAAIKGRLYKEQLKAEKIKKDRDALEEKIKKQNEQLLAYENSKREVYEKIKDDEFVDSEVKKLAEPPKEREEVKAEAESHVRAISQDTIDNYSYEAQVLQIKMNDEFAPGLAKAIAERSAAYITSGDLPADMVSAANNHENGMKMLKLIATDKKVVEQLNEAMAVSLLDSENSDAFLLKFNELADSIEEVNSRTGRIASESGQKKKVKPTPNREIKGKPSTKMTDDDELILQF